MADMYLSVAQLNQFISSLDAMRNSCADTFIKLRNRVQSVPETEFGGGQRQYFNTAFDPVVDGLIKEFDPDNGPYAELRDYLKKLLVLAEEYEANRIHGQ